MGTRDIVTLRLQINGDMHEVSDDPDTPLIYVLRDTLKLKGPKFGCGLEQCGACAVLADDEVKLSCVTPVHAFEGCEITTIEGISDTETGKRVQDAFVQASAAQCGYCTPGLVVAVTALLKATPSPNREEILRALTPHLCRCGSHPRVLRAVEIAVQS